MRNLIFSQVYRPNEDAKKILRELAGKVSYATVQTTRNLSNPDGYHSPTQASYINNPTPRTWGMCIEEQLNRFASALGWTLQSKLDGSRPDYYKRMGEFNIYADLTTSTQSHGIGAHIDAKINTGIPHEERYNIMAADIVYFDSLQRQLPRLITNGRVTQRQLKLLYSYNSLIDGEDVDFDPNLNELAEHYGHQHISLPEFTQRWGANRRQDFLNRHNRIRRRNNRL